MLLDARARERGYFRPEIVRRDESSLGQVVTLRKNLNPPLQRDGDLDSDVVFHEYGHGLTHRMIGGMNSEFSRPIGEGASDVVAFLINGDDRIGEYAGHGATTVYFQVLDLHDLDHLRLLAEEVVPAFR